MAVVLAATGLFLSLRFRTELDRTLNQGLRSRAVDVGALVQQSDTGLRDSTGHRLSEPGADFAQILDVRTGAVFDASPGFVGHALLDRAELRAASHRLHWSTRASTPGTEGRTRLLASPVVAQGRRLVVVVGASLEDRDSTLANLRAQLALGGPAALLLASLAGYGLVSAAMRPVNEMLDRLRAGLARERAFTADASHERRTPLTMLTTELQLMARERPSGEAFDASVVAAGVEADRLAALLGDLLVRALGNLVSNAVRHGGESVGITAMPRAGLVELHVRDDGDGFPPEFLPYAFDRFARPNPGQADSGTGLGLAIAQAVARCHGGGANAANRTEGGADVWLVVPSAR
jgi:two-component system OmpR family sensor kinase